MLTDSSTNNDSELDYIRVHNLVDLYTYDLEQVIIFLRKRFFNKEIYTWAGQTLLAIHPYEEMKFKVEGYEKPSIHSVVHRCWFRLQHGLGKINQAIVITGESGAGKSFSACMAIKYLASKAPDSCDDPSKNILWQVWSTVPLFSAFGNASTSHNHFSSRFGKFLQLQYYGGSVIGAYLETYLLEKSRVTGQNPKEGNFAIFRQLLDNLDDESLSLLYLNRNINYRIAPNRGPKTSYAETVKAMEILNINEFDKIFTILSVILNLGNAKFDFIGDMYIISHESYKFVENAARLLCVEPKQFATLLCSMQFSTKCASRYSPGYLKSPCRNREECEERRNCILKFLYQKLFTWLVRSVNARMYNINAHRFSTIGLLDMYGFEIFDRNTFEQLCINYANERIEQYFVNNYIRSKIDELDADGIYVENMNLNEFDKRISIIDGPLSIFAILNEECAIKRFNNDLFVNTRLCESLRGKEHFIGTRNDLSTQFSIKHYAGVVKYDAKTMLCKNRDKIPDDISCFLKNSKFEFLHEIINGSTFNKGKTIVTRFKNSLDNLLKILDDFDVHYIKCLKPNPYKISEYFDEDYFRSQVIENGVEEILKLNYLKFPIKMNFEIFLKNFSYNLYRCLVKVLKEDIRLGEENIYLTEKAYTTFVRMHEINKSCCARKLQARWGTVHCRKKKSQMILQKHCRKKRRGYNRLNVYEKYRDSPRKSKLVADDDSSIAYSRKIKNFLERHRFGINFEGDQLSLLLDGVMNHLNTHPFRRSLFFGDRIVSYNKLADIPVRLHIAKTCQKYSYLLPKAELPTGLTDIF